MKNREAVGNDLDTNTGFHAPARNDAPATKWMLAIVIVLLAVCSIIAVMVYDHYNSDAKFPPATAQPPPPLNP